MTKMSTLPIPPHSSWIKKSTKALATKDGKKVHIFELQVDQKEHPSTERMGQAFPGTLLP